MQRCRFESASKSNTLGADRYFRARYGFSIFCRSYPETRSSLQSVHSRARCLDACRTDPPIRQLRQRARKLSLDGPRQLLPLHTTVNL